MRHTPRRLLGSVGLSLLLLAGSASAQTLTPAQQGLAQRYYDSGVAHYRGARFGDAARAFREAHAITHRPELLYNIGLTLERAGERQAAIEALTDFLSAGAPGAERPQVEARIAAMREANAEAERQAQSATSAPTPPPTRPVEAEPRLIEVVITRRIEVRYVRSTVQSVGPWVTLGVGALVGVGGLIVGVRANGVANDVAAVNRGESVWTPELATAYANHPSTVTTAYVLGGVGAATMLGGALWLALRGPGTRREVQLSSVGAMPLPGGAMLTLGGAL
ncbi:MAG: hypothetical protein JNK72_21510 [Myxococcales bacterium]|nr:hypothetical protein [Myxococcales bacterium]